MERVELVQRLSERLRESGGDPVAHVIVEELWLAVVDGTLEVGRRLPTARELAIELGVSPRSIERAYLDLERRGVLVTRPGSGSYISLTQPAESERERHQELARLCRETLQRATDLGFSIDDVLDTLADFRSSVSEPGTPERAP
jgi:GntR family transcriptional regulator